MPLVALITYGILSAGAGVSYVSYTCVCLVGSDVKIGDTVTVGECRPLSKTVRFNVLKVVKSAGSKKSFAKF